MLEVPTSRHASRAARATSRGTRSSVISAICDRRRCTRSSATRSWNDRRPGTGLRLKRGTTGFQPRALQKPLMGLVRRSAYANGAMSNPRLGPEDGVEELRFTIEFLRFQLSQGD